MTFEQNLQATRYINLSPLFPGAELFNLRCSHGFPLDMALDRIISDSGLGVAWIDFIEEARRNEWPDFQTYEAIMSGLDNMLDARSLVPMREQIKFACIRYIASTNEAYRACLV